MFNKYHQSTIRIPLSVVCPPSSAALLAFVEKHKSVLDKLSSTDINNLTPIEAINLLNQIKQEIDSTS